MGATRLEGGSEHRPFRRMEGGEQTGALARLADDLPLFRSAPAAPKPPEQTSALDDAFADLNPDDLTPKEALELLYRLKALALD